MKHYFNEGKEIINQGRSKKQMENNYKILALSYGGLLITLILIFLFY
tara:strand:- start:13202 stop:13342 length:141 start_codon:yes stop_codon:yes gene_type:complete